MPADTSTIQHYVNGAWEVLEPPPPGHGLNSLIMLSPTEGWAVGRMGTFLHFQDGDWFEYSP